MRDTLDEVEGGEHRVVVGDVGEGAFWEGVRREVSLWLFFFFSFLFLGGFKF